MMQCFGWACLTQFYFEYFTLFWTFCPTKAFQVISGQICRGFAEKQKSLFHLAFIFCFHLVRLPALATLMIAKAQEFLRVSKVSLKVLLADATIRKDNRELVVVPGH